MTRYSRLIAAALILLPLSGCALNSMRVESARDFSTASNAAMAQTRTYLNSVATRDREAKAVLVASDPSCIPYVSIRIRDPNTGKQPLCIEDPETSTNSNSFDYSLRPLAAQLKPRLLLIAAIADYAAALTKITEAKSPDIKDELSNLATKVDEVKAFGDFLTGKDLPSATDLIKDKRVTAITALVQFFTELAHEEGQVDKIRELVAKNGHTVDAALASLLEQIDAWKRIDKDGAHDIADSLILQYERDRKSWTAEHRLAAVQSIFDARTASQDRAGAAAAVKQAVSQLQSAHTELKALLAPDPKLSKKQLAEKRKITRDRIWRALNLIVGAASAVAGG